MLFKRALSKTGQVVILLRKEDGTTNNPYTTEQRISLIKEALALYKGRFEILPVPNITHITYGREVGYTIEKEVLSGDIENISATKIREQDKS